MNVHGLHNVVKHLGTIYRFVRDSKFNSMSSQDESLNGLILINHFFPEEVIENILCFVPWKELLSCRLVCQSWRRIIDTFVGFEKLKKECGHAFKLCFTNPELKLRTEDIPFYLYYAIGENVFNSNHLKNPFGAVTGEPHTCRRVHPSGHWTIFYRNNQSRFLHECTDECPKFKHWTIEESGGDGWIVEDVPVGSQPLPDHLEGRSCFVTSYEDCFKEQCLKLSECGLNNKIMDEIQPHIEVSEWFARRFDCGIIYRLRVALLDSKMKVVKEFDERIEERLGDDDWHQVSHTFSDYGPGVRYVLFSHGGRVTQFWQGHYGSKMAGAAVIARIPAPLFERVVD